MALVKSVEIDIGVKGDAASKAKLDEITRRADELKTAFPEYSLKIDSAAAAEKLRVFRADFKATADEVRKPVDPVVLTGKAKAALEEVRLKAEDLRARFPEFTIRINDAEAKRKLAVFAAEARLTADRIDRELGGAGAGGRGGILGILASPLLSGGGGGGGGAGVLGSAGPAAIGGLAGLAAALAPGLIGLGIGGGVGALGVGGSLLAGNYLKSQVTAAQQAVKTAQSAQLSQAALANTIAGLQARLGLSPAQSRAAALAQASTISGLQQRIALGTGPGATAAQAAAVPGLQRSLAAAQARFAAGSQARGASAAGLQRTLAIDQARLAAGAPAAAGLGAAQAQLKTEQQLLAPFTGLMTAVSKLGDTALMTFARSVAPILRPVAGIFTDLGRQVKGLEPLMAQMFKASLPFISSFAQLLTPVARILMPALTQAMNQMVKSGALTLMSQGLVTITKGVAGFITALGPGMKSSAMLFNDAAVIIEHVLRGTGLAVSWVANIVEDWVHRMRLNAHQAAAQWDDFRHRTAVIFDGIRHDTAHIWDMIWQNTIGRLMRGVADSQKLTANFERTTAAQYDRIRHDIAAAWDLIWNNTIGRIQRGISDALRWTGGLPGRITGAVGKAGGVLSGWGAGVITGLLHGMTSVIGSVWGFIKGIPGKILGFLGIHSPPQWAIDAGKHIMNGVGIGMTQAQGALGKAAAAAGTVTAGLGGGVQRWAGTVAQALRMEGLSPGLLRNVLYQMQTESGGNPAAVNRTDINAQRGDPSRGLMQVIGATFAAYHWPGTSWNITDPLANIAAALNYARHVYGPALMRGGMGIGSGHGYALGTASALPGWAWVGERGPELLRFRGGEQVLPDAHQLHLLHERHLHHLHGEHLEHLENSPAAVHIHVHVDPAVAAVTPDRTLGRHIAQHITRFVGSGGRLYPQGVTPR